uniref:Uncharacterized protein n=1 Tax=Ditylenchus dipsaci TaxID=166011 RepID=A0A915DST0_9BILA
MQSIGKSDYESTPKSPLYTKLVSKSAKQSMCLTNVLTDPSDGIQQYGLMFIGKTSDTSKTSTNSKISNAKTPTVTRQSSGIGHSPNNEFRRR